MLFPVPLCAVTSSGINEKIINAVNKEKLLHLKVEFHCLFLTVLFSFYAPLGLF